MKHFQRCKDYSRLLTPNLQNSSRVIPQAFLARLFIRRLVWDTTICLIGSTYRVAHMDLVVGLTTDCERLTTTLWVTYIFGTLAH